MTETAEKQDKVDIFTSFIPSFEKGNLRIKKVVQLKTKDHVFIEEKNPKTGEWQWEFRFTLGKGYRMEDLPIKQFWDGKKIVPPPRKYWFRVQKLANSCECGAFKTGYFFGEGYKNKGGKPFCPKCRSDLVFITLGREQFPKHPKTMTQEEKIECYNAAKDKYAEVST
jgi:hypothetical protein